MPTTQPLFREPRRYGYKAWVRTMFVVLAAMICGMGIFLVQLSLKSAADVSPILWILAGIEIVGGVYCGANAFASFVALDYESVSVGGVFRTRSLRLDDIRGRRLISSRNGSYLVIEGKNPGDKRLTISNSFDTDGDWTAWVQSLADLDEQDRQAVLEAISHSEELGATAEARLERLRSARTVAIALSALPIAGAIALLLFRQSIDRSTHLALDLLFAILPWIAVWMAARWPLLYNLMGARRDPRPTLAVVLLASSFCFLLSPIPNLQFDNPATLWAYAAAPALILLIALYRATPPGPQRFSALIALLFVSGMYGFGVVRELDTQLDQSSPRQYSTEILRKTYSSGRNTAYYFRLSPWLPSQASPKVTVTGTLYRSVNEGDSVCITAHDGAVKVPWYTVQICP